MKKLILISALLLIASNGWAECDSNDDYVVWKKCLDNERTKAKNKTKKTAAKKPSTKKTSVEFGNITLAQIQREEFPGGDDYDRSGINKAFALGVGNNNIAYAFCANHTTLSKAIACAKQACLRRSNHCEIIKTNSDETYEPSAKFVQEVRRNLGQSNNQRQLSNNQSQQLPDLEQCLATVARTRESYYRTCPGISKQGGFSGFLTDSMHCKSQAILKFPDTICFGAKPPDPLPPPKQVCNFECNRGIIVQGNCNKSSITVGYDASGFINVCRRMN